MVGRQRREGGEKGQEVRVTQTPSHARTHTHVCTLADLQSHTLMCSHPLLALYADTQAHPTGAEGEALPSPSDASTPGFLSFLDYTPSPQCALGWRRGQLKMEPASSCPCVFHTYP